MRITVINGSPRKNGNTSELVKDFVRSLDGKADVEIIHIFDMEIKGCTNCGACQKAILEAHCTIKDDMSKLYPKFLNSDMVVLASPIYMWQFTPCTIAFLNRLHCLCHSSDFSFNAMEGKKMAILTTMGDEEEVADFAVDGLKDFCEYFKIDYKGDLRIPFAEKENIASGKYDESIQRFVEGIL